MFDNASCSSVEICDTCSKAAIEVLNTTWLSLNLASNIFIVVLSPLTVVGNALILAAMWKRTFQRTTFHVVLSGLAFSDLCTGLIVQPLVGLPPFVQNGPVRRKLLCIGFVVGIFFGAFSLLAITLLSIERWLHMMRRSLLTSHRRWVIITVFIMIPGSFLALFITVKSKTAVAYIITVFMLLCYFITFFAYVKLSQIIRQHQRHIQANQSSQNLGQPGINVEKFKRSLRSILYILALFSITFWPVVITIALGLNLTISFHSFGLAYVVSLSIYLSSSTLNPALYLWRMKDIRNGVKNLFGSH